MPNFTFGFLLHPSTGCSSRGDLSCGLSSSSSSLRGAVFQGDLEHGDVAAPPSSSRKAPKLGDIFCCYFLLLCPFVLALKFNIAAPPLEVWLQDVFGGFS